MPKVSVIMPLYNAEKYICYAVDSVLAQSFADFELIIVDDCGTDRSLELVKGYQDPRIRIFYNDRNRGIAYSRNRALKESRGEYIAVMDDDDWTPSYRLKEEVEYLDEHQNVDVVGGAMNTIDEHNRIIHESDVQILNNPKRIRAEIMFRGIMSNSSTMIRKSFIEKYHIRYRDNLYGIEDHDFWIRCSIYGNIVNVNRVYMHWRDSRDNETYRTVNDTKRKKAAAYEDIQRRALTENGFELSEKELQCFTREFSEGLSYRSDQDELKELYHVLQKMMEQGKRMDFSKELNYVCKMMFGRKVASSKIWDN